MTRFPSLSLHAALVLALACSCPAAESPAPVAPVAPRQTSGDRVVEPAWEERLTITVGPKDADIIGADHRALQAAVDHVARLGGGTVTILPGTYRLRNAVHLQSKVAMRGVTARNYHGDGISWQVCHDVVVENCLSENHSGLGLHPGSGSQRPVMRNNTLRGNGIGIFFCWGVKHGVAEKNRLLGNRVGISIGHRDTDNLIAGNTIQGSAETGLLFRPEPGPAFAGHRNRILGNTFIDNSPAGAPVIDIQGPTQSITLSDNEFSDSRGGTPRVAVKQGPETRDIVVERSRTSGAVTPP